MAAKAYAVVPINGLKKSRRRAIVFLRSDEDDSLDAAAVFAGLSDKREMELRTRFDYWIDGGIQDNYFHGWPNNPKYRKCFVFKWRHKRQNHRFYGFLCNPTPKSNRRFQLCVLCSDATKRDWNTDPNELKAVEELRLVPAVRGAIEMVFPDTEAGVTSWLN